MSKYASSEGRLSAEYADMVYMPKMEPENIVWNIKGRFDKEKIYTRVSDILIAVNPYRNLGLDTPQHFKSYFYGNKETTEPHIFQIGRKVFRKLMFQSGSKGTSQSILITGESGSGKTEATKQIIRYLADMSGRQRQHAVGKSSQDQKIEKQIIQANPLLEAFGNAATVKNDNSSRFGKWISVFFTKSGRVVNGSIESYLLEESRVVEQETGERNFNIFYQLCAYLSRSKGSEADWFRPNSLKFLSKSGRIKVDSSDDFKLFNETVDAMKLLGFSNSDRDAIFNLLKGILLLGNIAFEQGRLQSGNGTSVLQDSTVVIANRVAALFGINGESFKKTLTIQGMTMRTGSVYALPRSKENAEALCKSLAKGLYGRLFAFIVSRINETFSGKTSSGIRSPRIGLKRGFGITAKTKRFQPSQNKHGDSKNFEKAPHSVAILDIFGFEVLESNSFEQLCINYANEKLQNYFVKCVFAMELSLYRQEAIDVKAMKYPDNADTLALLEKRHGVFPTLCDQLKIKSGSDSGFISKLSSSQSNNPKFEASSGGGSEFMIHHFADSVIYDSNGFIEKNRAKLTSDIIALLKSSRNGLTNYLFSSEFETTSNLGLSSDSKTSTTLAQSFQTSLTDLLQRISKTESHFVRCIKPNSQKVPGVFEHELVERQLTTSGVIDAVGIRKFGYPCRFTHEDFYGIYGKIPVHPPVNSPGEAYSNALLRKAMILSKRPTNEMGCHSVKPYQAGRSLVFAKQWIIDALDHELEKIKATAAIEIQRVIRGYLVRKVALAKREAFRAVQRCIEVSELEALEKSISVCNAEGVPNGMLNAAMSAVVIIKAQKCLTENFNAKSMSTNELEDSRIRNAIQEAESAMHNAEHLGDPKLKKLVSKLGNLIAEGKTALELLEKAIEQERKASTEKTIEPSLNEKPDKETDRSETSITKPTKPITKLKPKEPAADDLKDEKYEVQKEERTVKIEVPFESEKKEDILDLLLLLRIKEATETEKLSMLLGSYMQSSSSYSVLSMLNNGRTAKSSKITELLNRLSYLIPRGSSDGLATSSHLLDPSEQNDVEKANEGEKGKKYMEISVSERGILVRQRSGPQGEGTPSDHCPKCHRPRWQDSMFCIHCGESMMQSSNYNRPSPKSLSKSQPTRQRRRSSNPEVAMSRERKLEMIFAHFDVNRDGVLDMQELSDVFQNTDTESKYKRNFSEDDFENFCDAIGADSSVGVRFVEFKSIYDMGTADVHNDFKTLGLSIEWNKIRSTAGGVAAGMMGSETRARGSSVISKPPNLHPRRNKGETKTNQGATSPAPTYGSLKRFSSGVGSMESAVSGSTMEVPSDTVIYTFDTKNRRSRLSISKAASQLALLASGSKRNLMEDSQLTLVKEGILEKRGVTNKSLKKRFCRIFFAAERNEAFFQYFKSETAARGNKEAAGTIPISQATQILLVAQKKRYFHIAPLGAPSAENDKNQNKRLRVFIFKAETIEKQKSWTNQLRALIDLFKTTKGT